MKLGQLYNFNSFDRFCDSANNQVGFQDVEGGVILARSLTQVDPKVFEKKFPELALMNAGLEADNTGGYAQRIQSLRLVDQGGFSVAGDASGNKGKISLAGEDNFLSVVEYESHSVWSDTEIKQAELQNVNLPSRYIATHNRIYMRDLDQIGLVGKGVIATGLLNTTDFTSTSASNTVDNLTAQEMYDEFATLITEQKNGVNNTAEYSTKRVIMPTRVMNTLQQTILDTANGSSSVLRALEDNFPGVQFLGSFRADTVANGGNLQTSATVAFSNTEDAMKLRIPQPLTIGEIIKTGSFDFKVDSKYRAGGIDILESTAGRILTGL